MAIASASMLALPRKSNFVDCMSCSSELAKIVIAVGCFPARSHAVATFAFRQVVRSRPRSRQTALLALVANVARVLQRGGSAFLHTSNYGALAPDSDWTKNHGNRSDMTADLLRQFSESAGLMVKFQRLSGKDDGRSIDDLDCLTLLSKAS